MGTGRCKVYPKRPRRTAGVRRLPPLLLPETVKAQFVRSVPSGTSRTGWRKCRGRENGPDPARGRLRSRRLRPAAPNTLPIDGGPTPAQVSRWRRSLSAGGPARRTRPRRRPAPPTRPGATRQKAGGSYGTCPRARSRRPCGAGAFRSRAADQGARKRPGREGPGRSRHDRRVARVLRDPRRSPPRRQGRGARLGRSRLPGAAARRWHARHCGDGSAGPQGQHVVVVENTPTVHNLVVCTLCSCYPWPLLGLPPRLVQVGALPLARGHRPARRAQGVSASSSAPRSRSGSGTAPAEVRYLVLPERPPGTEQTERGRARWSWSPATP